MLAGWGAAILAAQDLDGVLSRACEHIPGDSGAAAIGAQIRADVYGGVAPGNLALAVRLATADANLSHRGDGTIGSNLCEHLPRCPQGAVLVTFPVA